MKKLGKPGQHSPKQIEANKLKQLQIACEKMTGKGSFNMFTALCKARMSGNRLPALKLKLSSDGNISPLDFKMYNDIFVTQLNTLTVTTLTGETMTLGQYLREGMTLVCYSEIIQELGSPNASKVKAAFEGYQRSVFTKPILDLLELMYRMSTMFSDLSVAVFEYEINRVFAFSGDSESNHVVVRLVRSKATSIKLDGTKREAIPLQWPDYQGKVMPVCIDPALLGLGNSLSLSPVYIQRHGLRRLSERIGIVSGVVHLALVDCFKKDEKIKFLRQGGSSLVEFSLYEQKLGYLVCLVHEHMIVIRTFLFITNDGTPEGKKLSELTRVQLLDKQYLGIDTLAGFIKFRVAEDPILKGIFLEADCESLLDLSTLEKFLLSDVTEKDPSILLNYLQGIPKIPGQQTPVRLFL
ncbi:hypothetical protein [Pedobacter sp. V48]|uniref:hypothetical protein n=1 Tax=Pedobacter sp. V48 TaxID=509635 RepID=UPI0003E584ED|nr:hypothetical protein [Pedobacter sp. V48]ETZ19240.1 hypothetical protein N824_10890 [Pedobacter sp. V48]